ncbi:hypothetical protein [Streptomyces sp. NPDC088847]|uniref:hypothetical protein n=1 Tax=Streptomyces sp. NPDC088847 TaxID=3365909 RepID=UPI00381D5F72
MGYCYLTVVIVCLLLVRIVPSRRVAFLFFWLGAYALACLVLTPVVHVVYVAFDALGWRR